MDKTFSCGKDKIVGKEYTYTKDNGEKIEMTPSIFVYDSNSTLPNFVASKLLYDDYYLEQLTLLLRKSYGIPQQISIYTEVVRNLNAIELDFFNTLGTNKVLEDSKEWILNIEKINALSESESDILDKVASIFNVQRHYYLRDFANDLDGRTYKNITLNNTELYMLIYAQIIRNNFNGTSIEANTLYKKLNQIAKTSGLEMFEISMMTDSDNYATCLIFINTNKLYNSDGTLKEKYSNLVNLFYNGFFDVKSMGITYNHLAVDYNNVGYFDGIIVGVKKDGTLEISKNEEHCFWNKCTWSR